MARDRFDHRVDHSVDTKPGRLQRIEVITGVERRRTWSREEKLRIVGESLGDGAVVSEIARRHGISPQQLFGWRAKFRAEAIAAAPIEPALFAPAIMDDTVARRTEVAPASATPDDAPSIEIALGRAIVRVRGAVDA